MVLGQKNNDLSLITLVSCSRVREECSVRLTGGICSGCCNVVVVLVCRGKGDELKVETPEELDKVSREREVQMLLLRLLPLWPHNGWVDGWIGG